MKEVKVVKAVDTQKVAADWGSLTWYANAALGNSETFTVGRCVIKPGEANPNHSHPNCTEVLVVMKGKIVHALGELPPVEMDEGDVITVPPNLAHHARNAGDCDAELFVTFSSADRQTKGE